MQRMTSVRMAEPKPKQKCALGANNFLCRIGHTFNTEEKPDGKWNRGQYALPSVRQCILLQICQLKMRKVMPETTTIPPQPEW